MNAIGALSNGAGSDKAEALLLDLSSAVDLNRMSSGQPDSLTLKRTSAA